MDASEQARAGYKGYGLVRKADGTPRIDDPATLHPGIVSQLTIQERRDNGIWDGFLIRDAEGIKRASLVSQDEKSVTVLLVDSIKAAGDFWVDGIEYRMNPRLDRPAGETLVMTLT